MSSNENKRGYYQGFIYALILHLVLLVFIVSHFNSSFTQAQLNAGQSAPIIHAHTVMDQSDAQKVQTEVKQEEQTPPPPPPPVKEITTPKEVAFKSKVKPAPKKPEVKPVVKPAPQPKMQPVVKPVVKPEVKPKPVPKLTQEQRMQALSKKLQEQAKKSLQQQVNSEQKQLDQQAAQAQQNQAIVDKYSALIIQKIQQNWLVPEINKNIVGYLSITLAPGGTVLDVKLAKSTGNDALDRSAIQAVYKSSPLPVPKEQDAFDAMRNLSIKVNPQSVVSKSVNN